MHYRLLCLPVLIDGISDEFITALSSDPLPKLRVATIPLLHLIPPRGDVRTFHIGVSMGY
jgi:hypothetical protein